MGPIAPLKTMYFPGEIEYARPGLRRRLWKAGALFGIGLVCGVLLLPIPLIHLFGIMFFLAMSGLAARRLVSGTVLKGAHGRCPSCQTEGRLFVGFGGRRLAFARQEMDAGWARSDGSSGPGTPQTLWTIVL